MRLRFATQIALGLPDAAVGEDSTRAWLKRLLLSRATATALLTQNVTAKVSIVARITGRACIPCQNPRPKPTSAIITEIARLRTTANRVRGIINTRLVQLLRDCLRSLPASDQRHCMTFQAHDKQQHKQQHADRCIEKDAETPRQGLSHHDANYEREQPED